MGNPFYTPTGAPGTGSEGSSAQIRAEFKLISAGFDSLPRINTTGLYGTVFVQQGSYTFTLPNREGVVALLDDVAQEAARAGAAEAATGAAIQALSSSTNSALAAEVARAQGAEASLSAAQTLETQQRVDAVAKEKSDREAAIAALSSGSSATVAGVSAGLQQEISDRKSADNTINIRVAAAETTISNETGRAIGAENTLTSNLNAEITRARAAETTALNAATAERVRALQAEAGLQPALGFVPYNSSNPADYVTGARLGNALGAYATLGYVNATFVTPAALAPYAVIGSATSFSDLTVTSGTIKANGYRQAAANGYAFSINGAPGQVSVIVGISIETNQAMLAYGYYTSSDGRLKSNRTPISNDEGERFVRECPPYRYIKSGVAEAGFIAQDLSRAGFGETLSASDDARVPDKAFGYDGPKGQFLIMPDKTPSAYLAAALRAALDKIDALTLRIEQMDAGK